MNEFNVLLAAATNGTPSGSLFDALFARYIAPQESWRELESPFPITILAAGEDLIDYRIYGNTENGESVGERTENLFDVDAKDTNNGYIDSAFLDENNNVQNYIYFRVSEYISVIPNELYVLHNVNTTTADPSVCFYDEQKNFISGIKYVGRPTITVTTPQNAAFIRVSVVNQNRNTAVVIRGSTAPTSYIPFGYKLPMVSRTAQLFDISTAEANKYINTNTGEVMNASTGGYMLSDYIDVSNMNAVVMSSIVGANTSGAGGHLNLYDASKNWMRGVSTYQASPANTKKVFLADVSDASYVRVDYAAGFLLQNSLIEGSTAPTSYIPYYRDEENIYIGSDPLAEDEYVDFGEQKIYKHEVEMRNDLSQAGWAKTTQNVVYQRGTSNRVSIGQFYPEETKEYTISVIPENYEIAIVSANANDIWMADTGWGASWTLSGASAHSFCVTIKKPNNESITPSEVDGVEFKADALTPTDPPVPIPALPTIRGETIIDYNPSATPTVEPEKMYIKYKPQ